MDTLIGIDIGTSATKVIACDRDGRVLASASAEHDILRPHPGWSEQDPRQWWTAVCAACREVIGRLPASARSVAGVGLSGQMHGSVLLPSEARSGGGGNAEPLRPALLWNDQRTGAQCRLIESTIGGREALVRKVGNAALTGFTLPKVLWVRDHEPEVYQRLGAVCLPKDYVALRLTGVLCTDVGDASGTLLFDVARRCWHNGVCDALGVDPAILPPVRESAEVVGEVTPGASEATGLPAGTPVVIGSGDNMTSAVGCGVVEPGLVAAVLGTSGVMISHATEPAVDVPGAGEDRPAGRTHTFCAADGDARGAGQWCMTGCMLSAGGALAWCRDTIAPGEPYDALMQQAAAVEPGSGGLVFLPYLTGERCPHPDPSARGGWIGLTARHTRAHLVRSVVEGVCFGMAQILDIMRGLGVESRSLRATGGGTRSTLWRRTLADVCNCPVVVTNADEGPAYGAALLAGTGVGAFESVRSACRACIRDVDRTEPEDPSRYDGARRVYADLYGDLRQRFVQLGELDA